MSPQAPGKDPNDFTARYNTPLPAGQQGAYEQWARKNGQDPVNGRYDYDLQGAFLAGAGQAGNAHFPDDYKKPNHPTFSDQSRYHGVDGFTGGSWIDAPGLAKRDPASKSVPEFYQPSRTNLQMGGGAAGLQQYFNDPRVGDTNVVPLPPSDVKPPPLPAALRPPPAPATYKADGAAGGGKPVDDMGGYKPGAAVSRWTGTPIEFGRSDNAPEPYSGATFSRQRDNLPVRIEANPGPDSVANGRVLRHESVHALLSPFDQQRLAADPAVAAASKPLVEQFKALGYKDDLARELPSYMTAFSNGPDEWTKGVPDTQRKAYTDAYARALDKESPEAADMYRRMVQNTSPGTAAANVDLTPGAPPPAYRARPGDKEQQAIVARPQRRQYLK